MEHCYTNILIVCLGIAAPLSAQTVDVAKVGGTHTTVQAAIDSFDLNDTGDENIIEITDSSVYDEVITVDLPMTITGTGLTRPILAVQGNTDGFDNGGNSGSTAWSGDAGLLINIPNSLSTCTVGLKNLIIIPSKSGTIPAAGIVSKADNFYLSMDNILVTGNDGNDAPISTDGLTDVAADGAHVHFLVSGVHLGSITNDRPEGAGVEVAMTDCVITNIKSSQGGVYATGMYMFRTYYVTTLPPGAGATLRPSAFRALHVGDGCIFSFNNGDGLRVAASLEIMAPNGRVLFMGNQYNGLWMDQQQGLNYVDGIISIYNGRIGINEGVGTNGPRMTLKNSIIANNGWYGTYHRLGAAAQNASTYENVTIANNSLIHAATNQVQSSKDSSHIDLETTNTIITGDGETTKTSNIIGWTAHGTITLHNTAIVTNGPFALSDPPIVTQDSPGVNGTAITDEDPNFKNTTDPLSPDFYTVQNAVYGTLNSTGGPLSGGGGYAPTSIVNDWSVY